MAAGDPNCWLSMLSALTDLCPVMAVASESSMESPPHTPSCISSASYRHVIVTVGVLPPSEFRTDLALLSGVAFTPCSATCVAAGEAAGAALAAETTALGVMGFVIFAADATVGFVSFVTDEAGFGVLVGALVATATRGVGLMTGIKLFEVPEDGLAALVGSAFSSVGGRELDCTALSAAATSSRERPLVGVLVNPAYRFVRTATGCTYTTSCVCFACHTVQQSVSSDEIAGEWVWI
jgi:hypothetical protein